MHHIKLQRVKRYAVYYGIGNEEKLATYDLVILEPKGHTKQGIEQLTASGTIATAYLSMIEVAPDDAYYGLLCDDCFIRKNGKVLKNEAYHTQYMDLTKSKVRNILQHKANELIKSGYGGIFLDTIGNIEHLCIDPLFQDELTEAAALWLKEFRAEHQDAIVIQNNGLDIVLAKTAPYLDGVCFENPPARTIENFMWTKKVLQRLLTFQNKTHFAVLILEEKQYNHVGLSFLLGPHIRRWASQKGFLYYTCDRYYNRL